MSIASNITPANLANDLSRQKLLIQSMLTGVRTTMPVQVLAVNNSGDVSPIGYVDIQPLVNQVSPSGEPTPHATIFNVPYFRLQGGANAIIIDPEVGDIGLAAFCDRDISGVKQAKGKAIPLSTRKHDLSDALYMGCIIGAAPTQYIQFNEEGLTITSPIEVIVNAPLVSVNAETAMLVTCPETTFDGNLTVNGLINGTAGLAVIGDASITGNLLVSGTINGVVIP